MDKPMLVFPRHASRSSAIDLFVPSLSTLIAFGLAGCLAAAAAAGGQVEGFDQRIASHETASGSTASQAITSKSLIPENSPFIA